MNDKQRHQNSMGFGTGLTLFCWFSDKIGITMPLYVNYAGIAIGLGLMVWGAYPLLENFLPASWRSLGLIPLHKAAYKAMESTRNTTYGAWVMESEKTPDDRLTWFATALLGHKIQLYGTQPPLRGRVALDARGCHVTDGGRVLRNDRDVIVGENLAVHRKEMNAAIKNLVDNGAKALGRSSL